MQQEKLVLDSKTVSTLDASFAAAFGGAMLGVKLMRNLASGRGFSFFGVYCWGLALFTFILII